MRERKCSACMPCRRPKYSTISQAVMRSYMAVLADTKPICRRTIAGCVTTSYPLTVAVPLLGRKVVLRIRNAVVFPAPLGPSKP